MKKPQGEDPRYYDCRSLREENGAVPVTTLTEEITVTSQTGPEEAVRQAVARATSATPNAEKIEVARVEALLENMSVVGYRVWLEVTFRLDPETIGEREEVASGPGQLSSLGEESQLELVRQRVLLEDLSQEDIDKSDRFGSVPLDPALAHNGVGDEPLVVSQPGSVQAQAFGEIAATVGRRLPSEGEPSP
jgi:flavin-binding protein dodecin